MYDWKIFHSISLHNNIIVIIFQIFDKMTLPI